MPWPKTLGIPAENVKDWQGKHVVDPDGSKLGDLEAVYVDTISYEPAFVTVTMGMFGSKRLAFVPLAGATVTPDHVRVRVDRDLAKEAPSIDTDGELTAEDEPAVFAHYDLPKSAPGAPRRLARR